MKVRIGKQKSSLIVQVCLVMLDSKREQCQVAKFTTAEKESKEETTQRHNRSM